MKSAERFLTQGRISSAIKEYKTIIEHDPEDINTHNMLGDLYMKAEDKKSAAKCYKQAADFYSSNGHQKKAIAVLNKIHRIEPKSPEISIKLAELYQARGSTAEAKTHYENVAAHYESSGKNAEALKIWEIIAVISPGNTDICLKIANYYWQTNEKELAARAFIEAGKRLAECNRHEEGITAYARALEVKPDDLTAARGYVDSQISLGYPEEAVKLLDQIYDGDPYNVDVVFLLADCYLDMEAPSKAEIVVTDLISHEPKAYAKLLDIVDYYLKRDDLDSVVRIIATISEQLLVSQKPERLLSVLNEVVVRNPEQIQALRLLARYYGWHKNDRELLRILEQLADAAKYNESEVDERFALTQLLLISPHETRYISRLKEINAGSGETGESLAERGSAEISADSKLDSFGEVYNGAQSAALEYEDLGVREFTSQDLDLPEPEIKLTEADLQTVSVQDIQSVSPANHTANEMAAESELKPEMNAPAVAEVEIDSTALIDNNSDHKMSSESVVEENSSTRLSHDQNSQGSDGQSADNDIEETFDDDEKDFRDQLSNVKFYIEQGYLEVAAETLDDLDRVHGDRTELNLIRVKLEKARLDRTSTGQADPQSVSGRQVVPAKPETAKRPENHETDGPVQAERKTEDEDSPKKERDHKSAPGPNAYGAKDSAAERENLPKAGSVESHNQQTDSVVSEKGAPKAEGPVSKTKSVSSASDGAGDNSERPGEPVSVESTVNEKYQTHYHHAVAYQEMGLLEDAIREFTCALEAVGPGDGTGSFLQCCTLLGHCSIEHGSPENAIKWFEKAFESSKLNDGEKQAINYEIGFAYTIMGDYQMALSLFETIFLQDPDYRDVAKFVRECKKKTKLVAA